MLAIALNVTFGMRELDVIFITLMIPICIKLGYDAMTALAIVLVSSCAGFAAALANPFLPALLTPLLSCHFIPVCGIA